MLNEMYKYDETSPTHLRWRVEVRSGRNLNQVNVSPDDVAGGLSSSTGYYSVRVEGRLTLVHRVIWEMFYGEIPEGLYVDHIDQNRINNNINNLRLVTKAGNNRNQGLRSDSTSGVVGVNLCKLKTRKGLYKFYWKAVWFDGKVRSKSFSVDTLGWDEAFEQAKKHRVLAIESLNSNGAGYTNLHGKDN